MAQQMMNARQTKVLNRLLEAGNAELGGGFLGGMTTDRYAKITDTSKATATRDLTDLLAKGLLRVDGVGKAARYAMAAEGAELARGDPSRRSLPPRSTAARVAAPLYSPPGPTRPSTAPAATRQGRTLYPLLFTQNTVDQQHPSCADACQPSARSIPA